MKHVVTFFKDEFSGWNRWEAIVMVASCLIITALSLYWQDTALGIISSITGVAYTVCNGQGKRIAYLFGIVNSVLYAYISFTNQIYGDAALYGIYYLPAMVVGFILWHKHLDRGSKEVTKRSLNAKGRIILIACCIAGVLGGAFILHLFDDALPLLDSFTTVVSIAALIIAIGRYKEQWIMWTAVNAVEVVLWIVRLAQGGAAEAGSTLIMWALFLCIGIFYWVRWERCFKRETMAARR